MTYIPQEKLPKSAISALSMLQQAGFEAFVVGGWIRDQLLGLETQDVDIATNAQPSDVLEVFSAYTSSSIGEKHGTIGVKIQDDWIEITSYRRDGQSLNSRHPDQVAFVSSLKEDLIRRDFTINALAMDIEGRIIDWVSGLEDIQARRLRCVGDPEARFKEDALRILRALRFISRLNFKLDVQTQQAMIAHRSLLDTLAVERVYHELTAIFSSAHPELSFIGAPEVMHQILPETRGLSKEVFSQLKHLSKLSKSLAYLYSQQDEGSLITRLQHLKAPNDIQKETLTLHRLIQVDFSDSVILKKAVGMHTVVRVKEALHLQKLLKRIASDEAYLNQVDTWMDEGVCLSIKDLAINGRDLLELGLKGPAIQEGLVSLLEAVLAERIRNEKASLIAYLKGLAT